MKVLRVFWRLCTMSDQVARKAQIDGKKEYRRKPMREDFPAAMDIEEATKVLCDTHGWRPEKPMHIKHQFAEIIGHKIVEAPEPQTAIPQNDPNPT
jgi:hypothetical protein